DETFKMTQKFVDTIGRLYSNAGLVSESVPDSGTILLLLSCANRVFDVYEAIVGHMRCCIEHILTPVHDNGQTVAIPPFRIGGFAMPTPAAITMHMLVVILMASNLFDQLLQVLGVRR